jgi:hypothetical protein
MVVLNSRTSNPLVYTTIRNPPLLRSICTKGSASIHIVSVAVYVCEAIKGQRDKKMAMGGRQCIDQGKYPTD